jgi:hypothetical protein
MNKPPWLLGEFNEISRKFVYVWCFMPTLLTKLKYILTEWNLTCYIFLNINYQIMIHHISYIFFLTDKSLIISKSRFKGAFVLIIYEWDCTCEVFQIRKRIYYKTIKVVSVLLILSEDSFSRKIQSRAWYFSKIDFGDFFMQLALLLSRCLIYIYIYIEKFDIFYKWVRSVKKVRTQDCSVDMVLFGTVSFRFRTIFKKIYKNYFLFYFKLIYF